MFITFADEEAQLGCTVECILQDQTSHIQKITTQNDSFNLRFENNI